MNSYNSERRIMNNKAKRNHQLKKHLTMLLTLIVSVLFCTVYFGVFLSQAKSADDEVRIKYYKSVLIGQSESLSSIASENISKEYDSEDEYINEIKYINCLVDDTIYAGEYIIVPYYSNS